MRHRLKSLLAFSGFVLAFTSLSFVSSNAGAGEKTIIAGTAKVSDGGTIKFDGLPVRLWGIDAPEGGQKCGKTDAAALAEKALHDIADGRRTVCEVRDYDSKDKRAVAMCSVDGQDVAGALVQDGWAWDRSKSSKGAYATQQSSAKAAMKGVHILSCDMPSKWRARQKRDAQKRQDKKSSG